MQLHRSKYEECHLDCGFSMEIGDLKFLFVAEVLAFQAKNLCLLPNFVEINESIEQREL